MFWERKDRCKVLAGGSMEPSATGAGISGAEHGGQGEAREVGLSAELNGPKSSEHTQRTELASKHDSAHSTSPKPYTFPDHPPLWSSQKWPLFYLENIDYHSIKQ